MDDCARVIVADDSALMRAIVTNSLTACGVTVVGSASNGDEALTLCERTGPDAMTLDLAMPGLDGIGVLRALRQRATSHVPVVVVSAFSPAHGARAVDALAEGAFDLVAKPAVGESLDTFKRSLADKVVAAALSGRGAHRHASTPRRPAPETDFAASRFSEPTRRAGRSLSTGTRKVVVIATSTGGPRALAALLPKLPARLGIGTIVVQHMPPGFTGSLAARLDGTSALSVREAGDGEPLDAGAALIAPGGLHLRLGADGRTALSSAEAVGGLRPRADLLIEDAARLYGERLLLVVLTGMGNDALSGAREVRRQGGRVLVESHETCTVYGMPRAIVEDGLADHVLPLEQLPAAIVAEAGR